MVECNCILPQYARANKPIYHRFIVFSIIVDDNVIEKFVQCNNCGVIHKITEIGKSTILQGRDELRSLLTIDEIQQQLPSRLVDIMRSNDCQLHVWEHVKFIFDEKRWNDHVVINSELIDNNRVGKVLIITDRDTFGITQFSEQVGI